MATAYTPKCPFMVVLFLALAWVETAFAFLGARLPFAPAAGSASTPRLGIPSTPSILTHRPQRLGASLDTSNLHHGLPWKDAADSAGLSYLPMFTHTLHEVLRRGCHPVDVDEHFASQSSRIKSGRVASLCFESPQFRKIRMTYLDAGDNVQVFNTVWYPDHKFDLPIFGVDCISIGRTRVLAVIDFQPLLPTKEYAGAHIDHLARIREKYSDLQQKMSDKIYPDKSFFSQQMLLGRFADESQLESVVFPAFQDYLQEYLARMDAAKANSAKAAVEAVHERHVAYDSFNSKNDPAIGLFDAYFGKEWSRDFVHNFLFSSAVRLE